MVILEKTDGQNSILSKDINTKTPKISINIYKQVKNENAKIRK